MYFVYRSHYDGPLSKLVRRLPDAGVLDWFRRNWTRDDPRGWLPEELGADVYGLATIFEAARKHALPRPESTDQLRTMLHEHLYVEGDADFIRLDEHSLRVRTDDDEVELAYYFFDEETLARHPSRLAYLVHEAWPLPDEPGAEPAVPLTTYAVFLTFYDGSSLEVAVPVTFPGVGLAGLAAELERGADERWPPELRVLAALVTQAAKELPAPGQGELFPGPAGPVTDPLGAALERANRWPGFSLSARDPLLDGDLTNALGNALRAPAPENRDPGASLIRVGPHLAQMAMHCSTEFGFQQWFLFDTAWSTAYPQLSASLLRYAADWDPLDGV
ncbi:hypothetical protein [Actinoplanes sp. L3-i22]|uniref:hypothetical protein n=1 Tax=Actinoplanes sp. L3-i22 TaxID=2836373 RepID=UPI001C76D69F|nr:hypothetical protein [Actinoplanes sp. L3-i22]BCY12026.1 hypothetical protein L3i22_071140 [Actinoplanes sp. L3-i22]